MSGSGHITLSPSYTHTYTLNTHADRVPNPSLQWNEKLREKKKSAIVVKSRGFFFPPPVVLIVSIPHGKTDDKR